MRVWQTSFQIPLGGLGGLAAIVRNFSPHLNLGTVFPVIKLTQICYINMNISFSLTLRT